ncbi:hypothetical protein ACWEOZ_11030 [Actinoplanes sp. NPDC004185]
MPVVLIAAASVVLAAVATVRLWSRAGRWRLAARLGTLVTLELTSVVAIALVANRVEGFYPSWRALGGDTGATAVPAARPAGRLDSAVHQARSEVTWTSSAATSWRPAVPPVLILPPGYHRVTDRAFPVVLLLVAGDQPAVVRSLAGRTPDAVTVIVSPTHATTSAAMATVADQLDVDARVTGRGWAVVADPAYLRVAQQLHDRAPDRFATVVAVHRTRRQAAVDTAVSGLAAPLAPPMRLPS